MMAIADLPEFHYADSFNDDQDVPWHSHADVELVLVTKGSATCDVGRARHRRAADHSVGGGAGSLWVLPAERPQYQRTHTFTRTLYVVLSPPKAAGSDEASRAFLVPRTLQVPLHGLIHRWFEDLVYLWHSKHHDVPEVTSPLLAATLAQIDATESQRAPASQLPDALAAAIRYLEDHLSDTLTVAALGEHVCVSPSHLTALFRKHLGAPPMRYHQNLRIRKAQQLLANPYLSLKQVAAMCGFDDYNYFVRVFRNRSGQPPAAYRRQHPFTANIQQPNPRQ